MHTSMAAKGMTFWLIIFITLKIDKLEVAFPCDSSGVWKMCEGRLSVTSQFRINNVPLRINYLLLATSY